MTETKINNRLPEEVEQEESLLDQVVAATDIEAISPLTRAEIDVQIATAKRYPRSIRRFQQDAKTMATLDEDTAAACIYSLPRGGKPIEGPSVRLAEICAAAWTNLRVGARIVEESDKWITAQGFCHDLECNVASTMEVRRRITGKGGQRFSDDMVGVTGNAAAAIAYRNAIFKTIPKAHWWPIYLAAKKTAIGTAETLAGRRAKAFEYVAKLGAPLAHVLKVLGKGAVEDVGLEELAALKGLCHAIKEGKLTVDQAFPVDAAAAAEAKIGGRKDQPSTPLGQQLAASLELKRTEAIEVIMRQIEQASSQAELQIAGGTLTGARDLLGEPEYERLLEMRRDRAKQLEASKPAPGDSMW